VGTDNFSTESLSFERQLGSLINTDKPGEWDDLADSAQSSQSVILHSHNEWPDGVTITYSTDGRSRPHRPEVDEDVFETMSDDTKKMYTAVPVDGLPFDQQLELYLDRCEEIYKEMGCMIEEE
jgi:hypothetical protein